MALVASGSAQANQTISNADLSERVQTSDEWIRTRTGIQSRRVSTPDESLNDLAIRAGQQALAMAHGDRSWRHAMATGHGDRPWRQAMATGHGD